MCNPQDSQLSWLPLTRQCVDGRRVRLNEPSCTMGALKLFHSGIVLSIVDFHKGECLSPADILCSFHWCDSRVILFTGRRSTALGLISSRHVYETFLRYVLRYVLGNEFRKKVVTSYDERMTSLGMCLYDIYKISKLRFPNYFRTFLFYGVSWFRKASRNRLKTKMYPKTYLGHVLVLR
jgi:hypothetical protein